MIKAEYDIFELSKVSQEMQEISEMQLKKVTACISKNTAEFASHFKEGSAPLLLLRLVDLEDEITQISRDINVLAYDIKEKIDKTRLTAEINQVNSESIE